MKLKLSQMMQQTRKLGLLKKKIKHKWKSGQQILNSTERCKDSTQTVRTFYQNSERW